MHILFDSAAHLKDAGLIFEIKNPIETVVIRPSLGERDLVRTYKERLILSAVGGLNFDIHRLFPERIERTNVIT
jgi:hypothetical protein